LLPETACYPPPEKIFLNLDSFTREIKAVLMKAPEAVDAEVIGVSPEPGP
jgi:hypothetical protein